MINVNMNGQDDHYQDRMPKASNDEDVLSTIMHYILVQYNLHQVLKIFGRRGSKDKRVEANT